jgi:hypothetical protein
MLINSQLKEKVWRDESGAEIPVKRITKSEKVTETLLHKAATDAQKANKMLIELKGKLRATVQEIIDAIVEENSGKHTVTKNVNLFNFDRSIKLETAVSDRIEFDDVLLSQCKAKLDEMLDTNFTSDDEFVKDIIMGAFETSKGKPDHRKLMSLKKYASRVKNPLYKEAMDFLDKSIRRPDSRLYYRVWVKDANGKYQNIDLNFSSVEV